MVFFRYTVKSNSCSCLVQFKDAVTDRNFSESDKYKMCTNMLTYFH